MRYILGPLCVMLMSLAGAVSAATDTFAEAREQFLEARKAFSQGHLARYEALANGLKDYPLYPYLRYDALRKDFGDVSDADMRAFLEQYAEGPLAVRLRSAWLNYLAKRQQWQRFLAFYVDDLESAELRCHQLSATRAQPVSAAWLESAEALWLVGRSQPNACDPVFAVLEASPRMTEALIWQRIRLAMDNNELSLASYLARMLPAKERKWVDLWRQIHHRPSTARQQPELRQDIPQAREILMHAVQRLGRGDAAEAHQWWEQLAAQYAFGASERAQVSRRIALYAAYQRLPQAHTWLAQVPASARDSDLRNWQARSALLQQDWQALLAAIEAMPEDEQTSSEWRYWRGRAQAQLGNRLQALPLFSELAQERSYHGFLAADFMNWNYSLEGQPIAVQEGELNALLKAHPSLVRARELYRADLNYDARREWHYGIRDLSERELELAAVLAHRWNWHDRAIITAARAGHQDDLDLRFPVLYEQEVTKMSKQLDLDPAWIMGVMRQESAFMADARSPAGALGLMQLMPATGNHMAKLLNLPKPSRHTLLQADANIRLGTNYLKHVLDDLGSEVLATAAYNAGPHRVRRWLPAQPLPASLWVDTIPFTETRGYVRGVLAFTTVYEARMQRPLTPLHKRMPSIASANLNSN